jgi:hypothetical protein
VHPTRPRRTHGRVGGSWRRRSRVHCRPRPPPGSTYTLTAVEQDRRELQELQQLACSMPRTAAPVKVIAAALAEPTSLHTIRPESQPGVLLSNVLN